MDVATSPENARGNETETLLAGILRATPLLLLTGASLPTRTRETGLPQETSLPGMGLFTELLVGGPHRLWLEMTVPGDKVVLHFTIDGLF